jgi:uncharacterized membrane protein YciS (DUF1049 family)
MESDPASMAENKHTNRWMTMLALGLLAICLLACLYILIGFPAEAQTVGGSTIDPATTQVPASPTPYQPRRQPLTSYAAQAPATVQPPATLRTDTTADEIHAEMNEVHNQLRQSQEVLQQAAQAQHRVRTTSALFLGVFAIIAALIVIQFYLQARAWDRDASRAVAEVEAVVTELKTVRDARSEAKTTLPALLQDVGEQPLSFQEEGNAFSSRAQAIIDDIDDLAYVGQGRLVFHDISTEPEAAVYLNGLLLSAVAHLNRSDPWTAFARLDQFFFQMTRFPDAVERRRISQAYSYRALAGYMVLEAQDQEPSWQRKTERAQLESLSKQAFADIAHAASVDPDWRHTTFVEALLCSRFYVPEETADNSSRSDLFVRGLRRAVSLYKGLIEERSYRGPSRRNLARCLKRIAEQTGEKSDFSDFGYGLNAFPTDEELADEALAARQPASQDRFLWQWLLGDDELFANVERLNLAEYRAFWIRMLDTKVHLRNWRADLAELQRIRPAMKEWSVQLLQSDPPITLSNAISRRQERFDSPASGA